MQVAGWRPPGAPAHAGLLQPKDLGRDSKSVAMAVRNMPTGAAGRQPPSADDLMVWQEDTSVDSRSSLDPSTGDWTEGDGVEDDGINMDVEVSSEADGVRHKDGGLNGKVAATHDAHDDDRRPRLWTKDEDEMLRLAVERHGARNWKRIADDVPSRDSVQCLQHWKHVLAPDVGKGAWTPEEDAKLVQLVEIYGTRWSEIAKHLPRRIGKRCRERFMNHLSPHIRKEPWTDEEVRFRSST
jgi:hypothetical protein